MNIENGKRARKSEASDFLSFKDNWQDVWRAHPQVTDAMYRIVAGIAKHLNHKTRKTWVGTRKLARECGKSRGSTDRLLGKLEALGVFTREPGRSGLAVKENSSIYTPGFPAYRTPSLSPVQDSWGNGHRTPGDTTQDSKLESSTFTIPIDSSYAARTACAPDGAPLSPQASQASKGESGEAREGKQEVPPPSVSGVERMVRPSPWSDSPPYLPSVTNGGYSASRVLPGEYFGPVVSRPRAQGIWATAGSS